MTSPLHYHFRLYVVAESLKSQKAISNLKNLCEQYLPGAYTIEIIDLARQPERAIQDQIVALPTLVRQLPEPVKKMIGTLSNTENFLITLDIEQKVAAGHDVSK